MTYIYLLAKFKRLIRIPKKYADKSENRAYRYTEARFYI